jgi:hypothetical protein
MYTLAVAIVFSGLLLHWAVLKGFRGMCEVLHPELERIADSLEAISGRDFSPPD